MSKMTLINRPSKLHQNSMSKWRENSSILTCRRNFHCMKSVQIRSFFWRENRDQKKLCIWTHFTQCLALTQHVEPVRITTKLVLAATQNHRRFNVKFWFCFNVDKITLFRRWNTVLFNVNIKTAIFQALWNKNKNVFMVNPKSTSFQP